MSEGKKQKVDILNRNEFIDNCLLCLNKISAEKQVYKTTV